MENRGRLKIFIQNNEIEHIRTSINELIQTHTIIDNLKVIDDELHYLHKDRYIPFHGKQISSSEQVMIATKIIMMLNKAYPIILIGRGADLDNNKINLRKKLALNQMF